MGEKSEPIVRIFGILDITPEVVTMLVIIALTAKNAPAGSRT